MTAHPTKKKPHIVSLALSTEQYRQLRVVAALELTTVPDIVRDAIESAVSRIRRKHAAQEAKTMTSGMYEQQI